MANDKREQALTVKRQRQVAWQAYARKLKGENRNMDFVSETDYKVGYDAGHAAATAEGIPQADGWVDVAVDAKFDGPYLCQLDVPQECGNVWTIFAVRVNACNKWILNDGETLIAYRELPAPYQRKSEGE